MKKILSFTWLLFAAAMFTAFSCEGGDDPIEPVDPENPTTIKSITLKCDKDVIKCDGKDASTLTVVADDGTVLKEGVTFYNGETEITVSDFKFKTSKDGTYAVWAAYKTFNSQQVSIMAINADVPSAATDPKPSSTSFARKVFITQFTGTGCGYCPAMVYTMKGALAKEGLKDKTVIAASHSYNNNDPAYISSPNAGNFGGSGYPYLAVDMAVGYGDYTSESKLVSTLKSRYDAEKAKAGISANPVFVEKLLPSASGSYEDYLIVRVSVKAAETGEYTVGTWLLEDGIYGKQTDGMGVKKQDPNHDYDNHDNCLRVADSKNGNSWIGHDLGKIEAGKTAEKTFLLRVKSGWKLENMHMAIFVGAKNADGKYSINNVVDCPVNAATPFKYAN